MPPNDPLAQAPRNAVVSVAVTDEEKRAVLAVASTLGISASELLRTRTMDQIEESFDRLRSAIPAVGA